MSDGLVALFDTIRAGRPDPHLDIRFPFVPLDAPGIPAPTSRSDFIAEALRLGDRPPTITGTGANRRFASYGNGLHYLYRRALYDEYFSLSVNVRHAPVVARTVPGHLLGIATNECGNRGPRPAKVMLIGKHPGTEELQYRVNFVGPSSEDLFTALEQLGLSLADCAAWYVTNLVKWTQLDPQSEGLAKAWIADGLVLLHEELRLVRPDYILCLGSDASKALLGTPYSVTNMVGRVVDYTFPIHQRGEAPAEHTAKVMAVLHPAAVYRRRELFDAFKTQLGLFVRLTSGVSVGGVELQTRHVEVYKARHLRRIVDEILADPDPLRRIIAVDAEWHGEHPTEPGSYLRTVQFSTKHGEGITVVLRHQGGEPAFCPSIDAAIQELSRLFTAHDGWVPRIGGHFFRADLPWLIHAGLDLRPYYAPADSPEKCRTEGGWDTSLMYHAVCETASYKLEDVAVRLTTAPRYDVALQEWKAAYCKQHGLKSSDLEGYGMCPAEILHPYAAYDSDVTRRIAICCMEPGGLLDRDAYGNSSWTPYWMAHRASLAFLEMEMTGLVLDWERVDQLTAVYMDAYERLLAAFRQSIGWEDFNPKSAIQCAVFLFGDEFGRKLGDGRVARIRPEGAMTLNLQPIKTTGRRSKAWSDVVERGETHSYTPSTDKEVLGILGQHNRLVMHLRDLKFVAQVLQSSLRRPEISEETDEWATEDGHGVYSAGLPGSVLSDGRIRTHLYQTKETGRASSARPPLQNLSSRREADYKRILGEQQPNGSATGDYLDILGGPRYLYPLRSVLRASPGWVLVEADLTGAELAVMAWASGDATMIEHVRRNMLPENHPDYYDIHSNTAVRAFRLDCPPTKKGLAAIGKKHLRIGAKTVNFGIAYGRGAAAIARACREEGVELSEVEAQQLIDGYFSQYPATRLYLEECKRRVRDEGWLCNFFLRYRRFVRSRDRAVISEQEREAMNFNIQSTVADAVNVALYNMLEYRRTHPDVVFRILLQIHDAVLVECPVEHLPAVQQMLQDCMSTNVPIWPRYLDGRPMPVSEPYRFGVDIKVAINWGESLSEDAIAKLSASG